MFTWISKLIKLVGFRKLAKTPPQRSSEASSWSETRSLSASLEKNKRIIREIFDRSDDLVIREVTIGNNYSANVLIVYLDPLVKNDLLQRGLVSALVNADQVPAGGVTTSWLKEKVIPAGDIWDKNLWRDIGNDIAKGRVAVFVEGQSQALLLKITEDNHRPISQPTAETVVRGPSDAFNEDLRTNIALLRKRLNTTRLAVEKLEVGRITRTEIRLVYLKGFVPEDLIREIKSRIQQVEIDGFTGSGKLESYITDSPLSPFNVIEPTERPDRLASNLMEGRTALLVDTTPVALIFPFTLAGQLQSSEDYYNRFWFSSFIRLLRWMALLAALILPSFYIAVTTFHHELIPTPLLLSILASREGIPFPGFLEALMMELTFEILREAGVRLPRPFGQTISIVGAIVIGQAAVVASLVSPVMVVVVAATAIASYTIPSFALSNTIRVLRFPFMIAAAFMGLFGIIAGFSLMTFHLCSLRSFGVPFLSPLAPLSINDLKDTFIRVPNWMMTQRPRLTGYLQPQRQKPGSRYKPPPDGEGSSRERGQG